MLGIGRSRGRGGRSPGTRRPGVAALLGLLLALSACGSPLANGATAAKGGVTPAIRRGPQADYRLAAVNARIAHMTLDQELGQLFIVNYGSGDANTTDAEEMFGQLGAGGVILYHGSNIFTIPQMQALTHGLQARAAIPLIIGADEEGGGDDQINQIFGPHMTAGAIGATGDPAVAAREATRIANELKQLGMNADFAPVVDVEAPYRNWFRAFGHSPDLVTKMGVAQVDALQANGIMACPKHFPGLGGATINAHFGLPVIDFSRAYLEQHDFVPYRALMSHQPAMIMTTDLLMPALDPTLPAELSYPIVTGILRDEIGYDGVVVTDALYMGGIAKHYSIDQAVVLAIAAGNDMVEGVFDAGQLRAAIRALRAAVQSGQLSKARIDQSVRRILRLKLRWGMLSMQPTRGQRDVTLARGNDSGATGELPGEAALADVRRGLGA